MCFALPLRVIKKDKDRWLMEDGRRVRLALTDKIKIGDYLVCRQDVAVEKLTPKGALKMRQAIKEVNDELSKGN